MYRATRLHSQGRDQDQDPHSVQEAFLLLEMEIPLPLAHSILPQRRRLAHHKELQRSGLLHSGLLLSVNLPRPSLILAPLR